MLKTNLILLSERIGVCCASVAVAMLFALGGCATSEVWASAPPDSCPTPAQLSARPLDFGARFHFQERYPPPAEQRRAVRGSAEWDRVWHDWRPDQPTPTFAFGDSVMLFATLNLSSGPAQARLVTIRCKGTELIATIRVHLPVRRVDEPTQIMAAAAISRAAIGSRRIRFEVIRQEASPF